MAFTSASAKLMLMRRSWLLAPSRSALARSSAPIRCSLGACIPNAYLVAATGMAKKTSTQMPEPR
jgi:hypothetical protein